MKVYEKERMLSGGRGIAVRPHHQTHTESEHLHEFIEIVYIRNGNGVHGIDGVEYAVSRGSLLFINYRQVHYFSGDMDFVNILIDPKWISENLIDSENAFELLSLSAFSDFQSLTPGKALLRFDGAGRARIERLLEQMQMEEAAKEPGYDTVLKAQINILLTLIFRRMLPKVDGFDFAEYIRAHCDEKLTLESLARECFYNPSYFSRLFREHYGMTVTEYINRSRVEKAKELLDSTNMSAEEISRQVGYVSKTAFYKRFAESVGMTPQQYRKSKK